MINETPAIEIKYYKDHSDYEQITDLQTELSSLGSVRLREFTKDLGGDETNLLIIIQWFGILYAGGIIQHLAGKHYEKISEAIKKWVDRSSSQNAEFELAATVTFSYDDLDVNITIPNKTHINYYSSIMRKIETELSSEPIKSHKIVKICLPYFFDEKQQLWKQTFEWADVAYDVRYWGIASQEYVTGYSIIEDIYDSLEKRFMKAPTDKILENIA